MELTEFEMDIIRMVRMLDERMRRWVYFWLLGATEGSSY